MADPRQINARIWEVDPRSRGFSYCLVDYFFNIRALSKSKAPFNLWPFSFKFGVMAGQLIYSARIEEDDTIETFIFPNERGAPEAITLNPLPTYSQSNALTTTALHVAAEQLDAAPPGESRAELLAALESARGAQPIDDRRLADTLAEAVYGPRISDVRDRLPADIRDPLFDLPPQQAPPGPVPDV